MEISKLQARGILNTMGFLLGLAPEYLVQADRELCSQIFNVWPEFVLKYTILMEAC